MWVTDKPKGVMAILAEIASNWPLGATALIAEVVVGREGEMVAAVLEVVQKTG